MDGADFPDWPGLSRSPSIGSARIGTMRVGGRSIGLMLIGAPDRGALREADFPVFQAFADHA